MRLLTGGWGVFPADRGKGTSIRWKPYQRRHPYYVEVSRWQREHPTAGVALPFGPANGDTIGCDLDTDDPIEAAQMNEIVNCVFGPSPIVRVGQWPRTLRLYRGQRIGSGRVGSLEILGRGHYAVLYGVHPDTREPYRHVGRAELLDLKPTDLPTITPSQVRALCRELEGSQPPLHRTGVIGPTGLRLFDAMKGASKGQRHIAMFCIASAYRGYGRSRREALEAVRQASARCIPPYAQKHAEDIVDWVFVHLPPGFPTETTPRVLRIAHMRATTAPWPMERGSLRYRQFLAMCADLQQSRGDIPIALPQPALATILACSHQAVSKMIAKAVCAQLLQVADPNYEKGRQAKLYRFNGSKTVWLH
jgi:hypothetical protein